MEMIRTAPGVKISDIRVSDADQWGVQEETDSARSTATLTCVHNDPGAQDRVCELLLPCLLLLVPEKLLSTGLKWKMEMGTKGEKVEISCTLQFLGEELGYKGIVGLSSEEIERPYGHFGFEWKHRTLCIQPKPGDVIPPFARCQDFWTWGESPVAVPDVLGTS
ncbi:hypothetical protein IHE44_0006369 [Lamprotornis superbus]|uniref:Transmembrane protein TMEM132 cohesin-like domain-containing protein n=1 Tax=Lamprotornis superbus TaxID=245042 RepID=A0A835U095_9PASS|nr:hypothetical protein IHE44_0006369 [Lamprotornis superbus]